MPPFDAKPEFFTEFHGVKIPLYRMPRYNETIFGGSLAVDGTPDALLVTVFKTKANVWGVLFTWAPPIGEQRPWTGWEGHSGDSPEGIYRHPGGEQVDTLTIWAA